MAMQKSSEDFPPTRGQIFIILLYTWNPLHNTFACEVERVKTVFKLVRDIVSRDVEFAFGYKKFHIYIRTCSDEN